MTIVVDQSCAAVAERLRELAPVFVFTRVGGPFTPPDTAAVELREVLQRAGHRGACVIVAAPFAGFTALLYTRRHPEDVAGLVLVDSSHPRQSEDTIAALPVAESEPEEIVAFRTFLRGFGPAWDDSCRMVADIGSLGDLPLIVLAAGAPAMPDALTATARSDLVKAWHGLQQDHARRSRRGELRIVPDCGHAIVAAAPEAVIAAVRDVLDMGIENENRAMRERP